YRYHVVDLNRAVLLAPSLRRRLGIGSDRLESRVIRDRADDRGVELARLQHGENFLPRGRALDVRRIAELGDVRLLEGYPLDAIEIDAEVVGEDASDPRRGRHRIRAQPDSFSIQFAGRQRPPLGV